MQDFTQDRLIQSEKLTEFNIAYPIYITGWEVRQVQDINKLYARVFYKKSVRGAKAAKVKITCISEFGETIQEEIKSINDIDKKTYDFFEIYPLHSDTRKIQVSVIQGLSSDGTIVAETQALMVSNTFAPFGQEIESAAGQRLVASAKGYPIEMKNCWICCCGALNANSSEKCVVCESAKADVFEKITEENIKEQAATVSDERKAKEEQEEKEQATQRNKRKKRNKLIAILSGCCAIAIILFCSLYFPLAPLETVEQDGIEFTKMGEHYVVTDYTGNDTTVTIPDEIRGVQVTEIGYAAFSGCKYIEKIEIPESIINFEDKAFAGCSQLISLQLPNNLMSIGLSAFLNCEKLATIIIPNNIQSIGLGVLEGCTSLKILSLPIIDGGWSYGNERFHLGYIFGQNNIYDENCVPNSLTSVTITKADVIPDNLFYDCKNIANIVLPDNITEVGASAFSGCSSLQEINIPNGVTTIGNSAFSMCDSLTEIELSNNISTIGSYVFDGCDNLVNITLPTSLTSISDSMFRNCSSLKSITIPNRVIEIGESAFEGCGALEIVNIPTSVTSIGESAFSDCVKLTNLTIPKNVKTVNEYTFYNCTNLNNIFIEDGLEEIKSSAFANCTALTEIIIPDSVQSIKSGALRNCNNLQTLSLPFIGESRNPESSKARVLGYIFGIANSSSESSVTQRTHYIIINIGLSSEKRYYSESYCIPRTLRTISITDSTGIDYGAFSNCSFLTSININEDVTYINEDAFLNCSSLITIEIPNSVSHINTNAFRNCNGLMNVKFANVSGWYVSKSYPVASGITISSESLSNPTTAVTYLTSTYCGYHWYHS